MARGFESKDVEFQQSEAERVKTNSPSLTPAERADRNARHTIELSLARARAELANATSAVRRGMLEQAISDLERQLAAQSSDSRR